VNQISFQTISSGSTTGNSDFLIDNNFLSHSEECNIWEYDLRTQYRLE
jgi:hypothetical protein